MESDTTISVLFLVNSITVHGALDCVMVTASSMMSTCIENDYVHNLVRYISQKNKRNTKFSVISIGEFVCTYNLKRFDIDNKLSNAENINPDYLFVQIGENVSESTLNDYKLFHDEYASLFNYFPQAKKVIKLTFWPSKNKQKVITKVA